MKEIIMPILIWILVSLIVYSIQVEYKNEQSYLIEEKEII